MKVKSLLQNARRVLVFNPSFIGDAILTTPLVHALSKLLPDARIDLCVRPESAPLFKHLNTVIFDKRKADSGLTGGIAFAMRMKAEKYDLIISPHKSLRSTLIAKFAGAPVSVGFRESALSFLYKYTVPRDMRLHEVERNLMLLEPICEEFSLEAAKELGGKPSTYIDERYKSNTKEYFCIATEGKKLVGLNPGSVWATKCWPAEYFIELGVKLHHAGYALAVFGGPGDKETTDKVLAGLRAQDIAAFDFAAKVPFELVPAVYSNMDALVTNDSAPLHIAVSNNVPVVAIFGATVPALGFYPYDSVSLICENKDLDCRPCGLHGQKTCPKRHFKCMLDVKPDYVFQNALAILEGKR